MHIGEQIKEIRERKSMTQVELATKTGLSVRTISKIESGKNLNPTVYIIKAISKALDDIQFNIYN
ncbi:helix-turn-helix domain-containing protein [Sphingobacterium detergens]|uniref:helix-turn-helix domain-containing protein n=1 Tax=Sphingobacterium detergens TaxID=1145106 RepID=UPI003AAC37AD